MNMKQSLHHLNNSMHYCYYYSEYIVTEQCDVAITVLPSVREDCNSITEAFQCLFY
jgi:hypothetical protein